MLYLHTIRFNCIQMDDQPLGPWGRLPKQEGSAINGTA